MPSLPAFGVLGEPAAAVEAPTADAPFRMAILGDFSGRGQRGEKSSAEAMLNRKPCKITRENFDDIVTILKVQVKIADLQGEAFEHSFASLDDFHPDQIHEKTDRFAFVSDEDDKATLMAALLHHPHFQAIESAWRGVDWFLRRAQKGGNKVEVVLYDVTREEFGAALNASEDLAASPLYKLLIEQATQGPKGQPWTLWLGLYRFDLTAADAQVLGRIGKIARHAAAPFLAGAMGTVLDPAFALAEDARAAWTALRQLPESALLGLALPRFLLRPPYGENTLSVERFSFEEFTKFAGNKDYLWGNAGLAAAALLTQSFLKEGWAFRSGSVIDLEGMPMHAYTKDDEEEVALAETWLMKPMVDKAVEHGLMPLRCVKGKNAMQLYRFLSLARPPKDQPAAEFLGRWGQAGMIPLPRSTGKPGFGVAVQFSPGAPPTSAAPPRSAPPPAAVIAPSAAAPVPAVLEEVLDPELAALMKQFETPAAAPEAPQDALDPELAALMAQFDTPAAPPPAAPEPPQELLDPELAALMAQFDTPAPASPPAAAEPEAGLDPALAELMKQLEGGS